MEKITRVLESDDKPVVEHESVLESRLVVIHSKHASKHMSFNTGDYGVGEVVEREDGIAYNPQTATFYQTRNFKK